MQVSSFHYLPLAPLFFFALVVIFGLLLAALQIGILGYAYEKMGISGGWVTGLLLASLIGSYINIPVAELPGKQSTGQQEFTVFGMHYVVPVVQDRPDTILAVNVGGAIIPTLLSLYLMWKNEIFLRGTLGLLIVAIAVNHLAQPIAGKGIAVPIIVPPLLAALVGTLLSRRAAAPVAYVAGSLGTLLGADLMNLHVLSELGATDRLDRRRRHVRRHLSDRHPGRAIGALMRHTPLSNPRQGLQSVAEGSALGTRRPKAFFIDPARGRMNWGVVMPTVRTRQSSAGIHVRPLRGRGCSDRCVFRLPRFRRRCLRLLNGAPVGANARVGPRWMGDPTPLNGPII